MDISDRIKYLLHMNDWTEEYLGWEIANETQRKNDVNLQWQVSQWKNGKFNKGKPSQFQLKRIEELCYHTVLKHFPAPNGFRYICNLGKTYGNHYKGREDDALARLRETLVRVCPYPPVGRLQIVVFTASLPEGVRAQCFSNGQDPSRIFVILVNDDEQWHTNVRDEIFAHVLPLESSEIDVKED